MGRITKIVCVAQAMAIKKGKNLNIQKFLKYLLNHSYFSKVEYMKNKKSILFLLDEKLLTIDDNYFNL